MALSSSSVVGDESSSSMAGKTGMASTAVSSCISEVSTLLYAVAEVQPVGSCAVAGDLLRLLPAFSPGYWRSWY